MEEEKQTTVKQKPIQEKKKFPWGIWVTIIIALGILTAIAIPNMIYARKKAIRSHCSGNLRNLGIIITNYSTDHKGHYPQNIEELTKQGYIKILPVCPLTGESYILEISGWNDDTFTIWCPNPKKHVKPKGPKSTWESLYYSAGAGVRQMDS